MYIKLCSLDLMIFNGGPLLFHCHQPPSSAPPPDLPCSASSFRDDASLPPSPFHCSKTLHSCVCTFPVTNKPQSYWTPTVSHNLVPQWFRPISLLKSEKNQIEKLLWKKKFHFSSRSADSALLVSVVEPYLFITVPVPVLTFEKLWFRFRFRFQLLKSYSSGSVSSSISRP